MRTKLEELINMVEELEQQSGWVIFSNEPLIDSGRIINKEELLKK
jgi:hypothetical protein